MLALWVFLALIVLVALYDVFQKKHAILRNFPVIGHFRYILESIGPELRQYIVTDNNAERPFNRDERTWVYASAKKQNNYFGFGTDNEIESAPNYLIIKQSAFPLRDVHRGEPGYDPKYSLPCAKVLGATRGRAQAFRPKSVVAVSAMSFGSLSRQAVEALNRGCAESDCLHNTGEGGIAPYHCNGADLIWQLGTGYFGARNEDGTFSKELFLKNASENPVKGVEVKLSQGAKPGLGGVLPAAKITEEISRIRGIPRGKDCLSPSSHSAFSDVDSLLDFVEDLGESSGLPIGIKSAVGDLRFWENLAERIRDTGRSVDFITIDGGEGGTGAAPLSFSDHVALPFKIGFSRVYRIFAEAGLTEQIVFIGSGRLGFPERALLAFSMGCDMVALAREPMMAIGCIQAQRCHNGHCPTGVATQNRWLTRGLDPISKGERQANYMKVLRKELLRLSRACGVPHPSLVTADMMEVLDGRYGSQTVAEVFGYEDGWGLPGSADREEIQRLMAL